MNTTDTNTAKDLLRVRDLVKNYPMQGGVMQRVVPWVKAVDGILFSFREGEIFDLVVESD